MEELEGEEMPEQTAKKKSFEKDGIPVPGCREELLNKYRQRYGDVETDPAQSDNQGHWPVFISKLERGDSVTIRGWQVPARFRARIPMELPDIMGSRFEIDGDDVLRPSKPKNSG